MRSADAPALAAYRNVDEIARYQEWEMPFTLERANEMLAAQDEIDDVGPDRWVQIAIDHHGEMVGDLAVGMRGEGIAMLGYTLAPQHQGKGYASEAAEALVDALFEHTGVHRIVATLDPENAASMRVIEQLGFVYEGLARRSERIRGQWLDDMRFALLRDERADWRARPRHRPSAVELVQIASGEARSWTKLETHRFQRRFVASILESFADALSPEVVDGLPLLPWYRGIEADGERVGFVMMSDVTDAHPHPFLWRLVIDRRHQRRGIAIAALRQLIDAQRAAGRTQLLVSYVEGLGGPEPLYRKLGFVPTGEKEGDETIARLTL
jgi:RimJ/RimL family protein N-acetyltransferase